MFAMLAERYGLYDGDDATRVLLGGGSAGAFACAQSPEELATLHPARSAISTWTAFVKRGDWPKLR
jgi:hypothetical protein